MRRYVLLVMLIVAASTLWAQDSAANEQAALNVVRAIPKIQQTFMQEHPSSGYACRITDLGASGTIDPAVGTGKANGYRYEVRCRGKATPKTEYEFWARPDDYGKTGTRIFCVTEQGRVMSSSDNDPKTCLVAGTRIRD